MTTPYIRSTCALVPEARDNKIHRPTSPASSPFETADRRRHGARLQINLLFKVKDDVNPTLPDVGGKGRLTGPLAFHSRPSTRASRNHRSEVEFAVRSSPGNFVKVLSHLRSRSRGVLEIFVQDPSQITSKLRLLRRMFTKL